MMRRTNFRCRSVDHAASLSGENESLPGPSDLDTPASSDPEFPYSAPDEWINYIENRYGLAKRVIQYLPQLEKVTDRIDKIPSGLVACANIEKLRLAHKENGLGTFKAVKRGFDILERRQFVDSALLVTPAEAEEAKRKRGLDPWPKPITPVVAAGLAYLASESKLSVKFSEAQVSGEAPCSDNKKFSGGMKPGQRVPVSRAGAFFIEKSNNMLRTITDGRWANTHFNPKTGVFNFFTLDTLKSVIGNLQHNNNNKKWYAINLDLRHWFHQIPLPSQYWNYLGAYLPSRDQKRQTTSHFWLFPRALPMGWLLAPYIAQCLTWSLLLSSPTGPFNAKQFGLDPRGLGGFESPPAWLPLQGGGGIFILLDNILIVTPDQGLAEKWLKKIVDDCAAFNVVLKGGDEVPGSTAPENLEKLKTTCFFEMSPDSPASFEFLGLNWHYDSLDVKLKDGEDATLPGFKNGVWQGTRRLMASILGRLNWYRRAHGITNYRHDYRRSTDAILRIHQLLTPAHHSGWNEELLDVAPSDIAALQEIWAERASKKAALLVSRQVTLDPTEVAYILTDAAGSPKTLSYVAYFFKDGNYLCPKHPEELLWGSAQQEFGRIAVGELMAILWAVRLALEDGKRFIILGTDNMNCKNWIGGSSVHDGEVRALLGELHEMLESSQARLYVCYVPSAENIADEPSRRQELKIAKLIRNHALLSAARLEAFGAWNASGTTCGVTNVKLNDEK